MDAASIQEWIRKSEKYEARGIEYRDYTLLKQSALVMCLLSAMKTPIVSNIHLHDLDTNKYCLTHTVELHGLSAALANAKRASSNMVFVFVTLYNEKDSHGGHANLLVYKKRENTVEHFDPFGANSMPGPHKRMGEIVEAFLSNDAGLFLPDTAERGFQSLETGHKWRDGKGFCTIWTCLIAFLYAKHPHLSLRDIQQRLDKESPIHLVRGFLDYMKSLLDKQFPGVVAGFLDVPVRPLGKRQLKTSVQKCKGPFK
jgi:hypothetical protein